MKQMNMRHLKALELHKILQLCEEFAVTDQAKKEIGATTPATDYFMAIELLQLTKTANDLTVRFGSPGIYNVRPTKDLLMRATRSATLSPQELLDVFELLRCVSALLKWYASAAETTTPLSPLFESLSHNQWLENEISRCIISVDEIADDASAELSSIRRQIRNSNNRAREALDKIVRSTTYQKYLQDAIITMRNGRFCVPVKAEHKNEVKGLVHDTSASGSTFFIEPMAVVELNNQIRELEIAQQKEIDRVLLLLSSHVAEDSLSISSNYNTIVVIDTIFAKSKLADSMKAMPVNLVESGETILIDARHPLINKDNVVPINISIGGEFDTLIITGPNTGGKTVALKTLGLLTLMAQCGMMIPASTRSIVSFYPKVLVDIGDEQSIEQSLSTFSGHMTNIVEILKEADRDSLVLMDELGAGTDPVEGAALAIAIISKLRDLGAKVATTTHYAELKMFALETPQIENASCEFDVATLRPTYRLLIGMPGRSNAFAISSRLGIPQEIIETAEAFVSSEDKFFENVVSKLEATRQDLEQERKQAQNLRQQAATAKEQAAVTSKQTASQQEKLLEDARSRARTIVDRTKYQADQILEELELLKKAKDKENFAADFASAQGRIKSILSEMDDIANPIIAKENDYKLPRKLKEGDIVFLVDFNTEGTVLSLPDNKGNIRVKAGILETKIPQSRVRLLDKSNKKITFNGGAVKTGKSTASDATAKLDLRGFDSSEAEMELMQFIDRCTMQKLKLVTVVHGKGTGVLRNMVTHKLRSNKLVESYRLGEYGEGGDGVTIVSLT